MAVLPLAVMALATSYAACSRVSAT